MSQTKPRLETSIRHHLQPHLRADGFTGSGRNFRRVRGGIIQVVNIQGSQYGGQFAINLGLQPLGIPDVMNRTPDPKKITEPYCEFRRRMSETGVDQWWRHDGTEAGMDAAVQAAADVYVRVGRSLLAEMGSDGSPIHSILPDEMPVFRKLLRDFGSTDCRIALVLARLRKSQGRLDEAVAFAAYSKAHIGRAGSLAAEIEALLQMK